MLFRSTAANLSATQSCPVELDLLGGQALRFLGLIPEPPAKKPETEQTEGDGESKGDPGLETVKN